MRRVWASCGAVPHGWCVCVCVCVYVHIYIHDCICMNVCVCIHPHTHTGGGAGAGGGGKECYECGKVCVCILANNILAKAT